MQWLTEGILNQMKMTRHRDPYLKPGRLADVIAAVQVMASAKRPEAHIRQWAHVSDRNREPHTIARWASVFEDHREFFITYHVKDDPELKAALRWRYAFKTWDPKTDKVYGPLEINELPDDVQRRLTSQPLEGAEIQTLLTTAIDLRTRAVEGQSAARWWVPILAASLGLIGAILGAFVSGLFKSG